MLLECSLINIKNERVNWITFNLIISSLLSLTQKVQKVSWIVLPIHYRPLSYQIGVVWGYLSFED
jgi:hypothetical protein